MSPERQPGESDLIMDRESPRCECGVFGLYDPTADVSREAYLALRTLQHRGHESAGIAVSDGARLHRHSGRGLVSEVFDRGVLDGLRGTMSIGHNRYSTAGGNSEEDLHPFVALGGPGEMALAHNGNLTNTEDLLDDLRSREVTPKGTTDSELAALWIATAPEGTWERNIDAFMDRARGAYSMSLLTRESIYAFSDPHGVRPLQIGRTESGWAVSSETMTFRTLGYRPYRPVAPGEIVRFNHEGMRTISHRPAARRARCIFEHVYFSRPDSVLDEQHIYSGRTRAGRELAREHPVDVDVVTPVPQSGNPYAVGFADQLGLHHEVAFARNDYVGRSFIAPGERRSIVEMKLNPLIPVIKGRRVCIVDDSLVRGSTMPAIVDMMWDAGATEVHVRIASPPIIDTCHLGVDIPTREELIANRMSLAEISGHVKAHSLEYLSEDGMYRAFEQDKDEVCAACMRGDTPFPGARPGASG